MNLQNCKPKIKKIAMLRTRFKGVGGISGLKEAPQRT